MCIQLQPGESTFHVERASARKAHRAEDYAVDVSPADGEPTAVSVRPLYELTERQIDGWTLGKLRNRFPVSHIKHSLTLPQYVSLPPTESRPYIAP